MISKVINYAPISYKHFNIGNSKNIYIIFKYVNIILLNLVKILLCKNIQLKT